jgi:ribose transport system substrate-binding protein
MAGLVGLASVVSACSSDDDKEPSSSPAAASGGQKKLRAGLLRHRPGSGSSWEARGIKTAKLYGDLLGVEVTVFDANFTAEKQRQQLEQIAGQDFDFVAIHAGAINAFVDPVKAILGKKIPVIQMDTKIADDTDALGVTTFIEPDNIYMGETMATMLFNSIGGSGEVIHTQGQLTHTGRQLRGTGFKNAAAKFPGIKVVDESSANWSADETTKLWENLLVKFPDVKGGYFHNDDMALAAGQVAKAKSKDVKLVGIDGMEPACDAVGRCDPPRRPSSTRPGASTDGAMWVGYLAGDRRRSTACPRTSGRRRMAVVERAPPRGSRRPGRAGTGVSPDPMPRRRCSSSVE